MDQQLAVNRPNLRNFKNIISLVLLLAMAAVFLFSGLSKLLSYSAFEQFTWSIMDSGIPSLSVASVIARLFIGLEVLLGLFMILHLFLRSFTYPVTIVTLIVFTIYLLFLLRKQGNEGDCGCFGEAYKMSPLAGIIKNVVMIAVTLILSKLYPYRLFKNTQWIAPIAGLIAFALPFIVMPLEGQRKPQAVNMPVNLSPLYESANPKNTPPEIDVRVGKHIVAFLSLSCKHCRKAAFQLQVMYKQNSELPIFLVLNGDPDGLDDFMKETRASIVPHHLFFGPGEFLSMSGPSVPAILWINNGVAEYKSSYYELDPAEVQRWLMKR